MVLRRAKNMTQRVLICINLFFMNNKNHVSLKIFVFIVSFQSKFFMVLNYLFKAHGVNEKGISRYPSNKYVILVSAGYQFIPMQT